MIKGIKAVLFDCDGVLCEPWGFANVLLEQHGISLEMTSKFFKTEFMSALVGENDLLEVLPEYLRQWGWSGTVYDFINLWLDSERETNPDTIALVKECRSQGVVTALATNQETHRARYMRSTMGFDSLFDYCFISSEMGCRKPQAEFYEQVGKALNLPPEEILFLDDHPANLEPAELIGWKTHLFTTPLRAREVLLTPSLKP